MHRSSGRRWINHATASTATGIEWDQLLTRFPNAFLFLRTEYAQALLERKKPTGQCSTITHRAAQGGASGAAARKIRKTTLAIASPQLDICCILMGPFFSEPSALDTAIKTAANNRPVLDLQIFLFLIYVLFSRNISISVS